MSRLLLHPTPLRVPSSPNSTRLNRDKIADVNNGGGRLEMNLVGNDRIEL